MTHDLVVYLLSTAKGWPFLAVCGFVGLSFAATLACVTANWFRPVNHEEDNEAYLQVLRDERHRNLARFEQDARRGFFGTSEQDQSVVDIKTRERRRVH